MTVGLWGFAAMIALLALGIPVAYAIGTVAIAGIFYAVGPVFLLSTIQSLPYAFASDYNFVVVPLFVLMGALASRAGIISDLYQAAFQLTSRIRGSLMMATVLAQAMFAAISGSTTVAANIFTRMALPEMTLWVQQGRFSGMCGRSWHPCWLDPAVHCDGSVCHLDGRACGKAPDRGDLAWRSDRSGLYRRHSRDADLPP